jgi:hypothetical protein
LAIDIDTGDDIWPKCSIRNDGLNEKSSGRGASAAA